MEDDDSVKPESKVDAPKTPPKNKDEEEFNYWEGDDNPKEVPKDEIFAPIAENKETTKSLVMISPDPKLKERVLAKSSDITDGAQPPNVELPRSQPTLDSKS